jgi:hypothetical protein
MLNLKNGAEVRYFTLKLIFIQKNAYFYLKVALFVEKRQNKFAYELK